jgi:hypothetical protein
MIVNSIETNNPIPFDSTTCGSDAYARGSGQKIVGFSFFGDIELEERINKNCLGSFQVLWNKTAPPKRMILGI